MAIVTTAATALNPRAPKALGPTTLPFDFASPPGSFDDGELDPADDALPAGPVVLGSEEVSPELEPPGALTL